MLLNGIKVVTKWLGSCFIVGLCHPRFKVRRLCHLDGTLAFEQELMANIATLLYCVLLSKETPTNHNLDIWHLFLILVHKTTANVCMTNCYMHDQFLELFLYDELQNKFCALFCNNCSREHVNYFHISFEIFRALRGEATNCLSRGDGQWCCASSSKGLSSLSQTMGGIERRFACGGWL